MPVITIKYCKTQFVHLKDIVHLCLLLVFNAILYNKKNQRKFRVWWVGSANHLN